MTDRAAAPAVPLAPTPREGTLAVRGGRPLKGEIVPAGAKNAALPLLVAASLGEKPTRLTNVPLALNDVQILLRCLSSVGAEVRVIGDDTVELSRGTAQGPVDPAAARIRYSLLLLGRAATLGQPLDLPTTGGCSIGERGHDLHVLALEALGQHVVETAEGLSLKPAPLTGADISFRLPTTGGTENAIIAAVQARGHTIVRNANTRPEIRQMAELLNRMGAQVTTGGRVVRIEGRANLAGGAEMAVMPGWDEAVTYLVAGAITGGEIRVRGVPGSYVRWDLLYLREAGATVFEWGDDLFLTRKEPLRAIDVMTGPPPCLNSDMQPIFAALTAFCPGDSTLTDNRFQDRFQYADELRKLGVAIDVFGNSALVEGGRPLTPCPVRAPDLRGGACLALVGLGLEGETRIGNAYQIFRGYPAFDEKLRALGADVQLVTD